MDPDELPRCRRCGRTTLPPLQVRSRGRTVGQLVVDPDPHELGDVLVVHNRATRLTGPPLEAARTGGLSLHVVHVETCPASGGRVPVPDREEEDPWKRRRDLDL